jgi:hypothetical protein
MLYRYLLRFAYKDDETPLLSLDIIRDKELTIILKNPSSADYKAADNTIQRVQSYVFANFPDVKAVNVLNLFGIRGTEATEVNLALKEHSDEYIIGSGNNDACASAIQKADYLIVAWGGNSGIKKKNYDERIETIWGLIVKYKKDDAPVFRVNPEKGSEQYPFHACFWGKTFGMKEVG